MSTIQKQIVLAHLESDLTVPSAKQRTTVESAFTSNAITVTSTPEALSLGDISSPRDVVVKLVSGDDCLISLDGGTSYPLAVSGANDAQSLGLNIREISTITAVADVASSLSGLYFDIYEAGDLPVRVWFNMAATAAFGTLTLAGNAVDAETVVLGATTYTFKTALTPAANEVLIGATASDSLDNLIAAINAGAGSGTLYGTGTTANASASAAAGAGDTMVATALTAGTAGNDIDSTETITNGSWGGLKLSGGSAASVAPSVPTNGRLLPVVIVEGSANTVVATAIAAAIDADDSFYCTAATATLTITDAGYGARTAINGWTAVSVGGFTIGADASIAPSVYFKSLGTSEVVVAIAPN